MSRAASPLRDRMVFLVGAQRSGTNWLQRMLATHPDVATLPSETQLFTTGLAPFEVLVQHGLLGSPSTASVFMDREDFLDATRDFCDRAFGGVAERLQPGAPRVVERSPNHVEHLGLIGAVYPDAWFLHIVRDGRDVARSLQSQPWGPRTVREATERWARSVRSARAVATGLDRYREVSYERLLADPAGEISGVFQWLGVDASESVVAAAAAEARVSFNADHRRPEIAEGKWRDEWTTRQLAEFLDAAGDLLTPEQRAQTTRRPHGKPVRAAARRVVRVARRPFSERVPPGPAPLPRPRVPMEVRQRKVNDWCAAASAGDVERMVEALAPNALVRIVIGTQDVRARGEAGADLLRRAICADSGPWGRQVRGDSYPSGTFFTAVLAHEAESGLVNRVVVMGFDAQDGIDSVAYYRMPVGGPAGAMDA